MDENQRIVNLYKSVFSEPIISITPLQEAGSFRRYYRLLCESGSTFLACVGTNTEENKTFIAFSKALHNAGINVPQVYACDAECESYLISDLGNTDVLHAKASMSDDEICKLYKTILKDLIRIQIDGGRSIDFSHCFVRQEFDRTAMYWDLSYFKYYYLKISGLEINEQWLENDFTALLDFLDTADRSYFMYRDFQARNIMLDSLGKPGYIDFQGGMRGPLQYDIVSLLYQAKAHISETMRTNLLDFYIEELKKELSIDEQYFRNLFKGFVFIRILQTLGAYGFRGLIQRKEHFIQSIPQALANLKAQTSVIQELVSVPYLCDLIEKLPDMSKQ